MLASENDAAFCLPGVRMPNFSRKVVESISATMILKHACMRASTRSGMKMRDDACKNRGMLQKPRSGTGIEHYVHPAGHIRAVINSHFHLAIVSAPRLRWVASVIHLQWPYASAWLMRDKPSSLLSWEMKSAQLRRQSRNHDPRKSSLSQQLLDVSKSNLIRAPLHLDFTFRRIESGWSTL